MANAQDLEANELPAAEPEYNWAAKPSSLNITMGVPSMAMWIDMLGTHANYTGSYSIRYDYNLLRWLAIGGRLSYEGSNYSDGSSKYVNHRAAVQMEVLFTYLNREHVQLYSGLCMGMSYFWETENKTLVNSGLGASNYFPLVFSAIPIGVHVGSDRVYALAELSLGYEAMMSLGIGVHF